MTLTDDIYLPTPEEIKHKDIPLTHNYFLSSAMWLGKYCDNQSKEFMLCRKEEQDPRKCLEYGRQLTDCGMEFFRFVKHNCREELEWYTKCLDWTGPEPSYRRCRHEQALFDGCMADNGMERAHFGYFQMMRVHHSDRPRPKAFVPVFPDAAEDFNLWEANQGKKKGIFAANWKAWTK